jgi:hypothetical protein
MGHVAAEAPAVFAPLGITVAFADVADTVSIAVAAIAIARRVTRFVVINFIPSISFLVMGLRR